MTADNGGPAFPRPAVCGDGFTAYEEAVGMSLRDWFAGQIASGIAAGLWHPKWVGTTSYPGIAQDAYAIADAMLAERQKAGADNA